MEITSVKMTLKYSKQTPDGWKGLELGAEANITAPYEDHTTVIPQLYNELRTQFAKLWNANSITENGHQEQLEPEVAKTNELATEKQCKKILALGHSLGYDNMAIVDMCANRYGRRYLNYLTKEQASDFISYLDKLNVEARR